MDTGVKKVSLTATFPQPEYTVFFPVSLSVDCHIFHVLYGNKKCSKLRLLEKKILEEQYHLH